MTNFSPKNLEQVINQLGEDRVIRNQPLASHTYFKIGGPADAMYVAGNLEELATAVKSAISHHVPYTVLGAASNVLIRDGGIRGLVIKNRADKISLAGFSGKITQQSPQINTVLVKAESGVIVNHLVRFTIEESLAGLEEFLGIPGTVGGAVYNNSHHLGHLIGDYVHQVTVIDLEGHEKTYTQEQLKFDYDHSILQKTKETILSITFRLQSGHKDELWRRAEAALKRRRDTQPLELPSSGCMFKNIGTAQALQYNTPNRATGAGFLIDHAGLKGLSIGGAVVSDKHANFIINTGSATAKDVEALVKKIKRNVKKIYGVTLTPEVFTLGEEA